MTGAAADDGAAAGLGGGAADARALELLDRSLAWLRPAVGAVPGHGADEPTPCRGWRLADLLAHLVDGLTAFVEASSGLVLPPRPSGGPRDPALLAALLLDLTGDVLGGWVAADGTDCRIGPARLAPGTLVEVAALEVAVHGWDLSSVVLPGRRLPPELAAALLPLAYRRVGPADRPGRFDTVLQLSDRDPAALLLAHLGRRAGPAARDDDGQPSTPIW